MIRIPLYRNAVIPILLLFTTILLVACGGHGTVAITPTALHNTSQPPTTTASPTHATTLTTIPTKTHTTIATSTPTFTLTLTKTPTKTKKPSPTKPPTPSRTPTATPQPFLISYTEYSDGGDDLWICKQGIGQPSFILYTDGELIYLRDGQYWRTKLSQDEITALLDDISSTGLFQLNEKDYTEGNSELVVNGKLYRASWDTPESDPLSKALEIIFQYQPKDVERYVPESLRLEIYRSDPDYIATLIHQYNRRYHGLTKLVL